LVPTGDRCNGRQSGSAERWLVRLRQKLRVCQEAEAEIAGGVGAELGFATVGTAAGCCCGWNGAALVPPQPSRLVLYFWPVSPAPGSAVGVVSFGREANATYGYVDGVYPNGVAQGRG
jgi:hypothetical protein